MPTAATCHPDRPVEGFGLCGPCYRQQPEVKARLRAARKRWDERNPNYEWKGSGQALCHPDRPRWSKDGLCRQCRSSRYYQQNKEAIIKRTTTWNRTNLDKRRHIKRKYDFGMTREQYEELFELQKGLCAICRIKPATHIDHDHKTKRVRGILCNTCNTAIGMLRENKEILLGAIEYIEFWSAE